jgi:molybdopterin/thiamine biosynthesis adenylyltransferase
MSEDQSLSNQLADALVRMERVLTMMEAHKPLTDAERERYQWQLSVPGFGDAGQHRLKGASVLVSRCGGVGGAVAYQLAAAGVGRIVLAHAGKLRLDDLNRQLLMTTDGVGTPRADLAARRLRELNPTLEIQPVAENVSAANVERLVGGVDLVAACAPTFAERLLMNRAAVSQGKPLVDCAMYELQAQLTTVIPGRTPCLACLYPAEPPHWKREFPVFGAVAGAVGCLGAMETIKVLSGLGEPLLGHMLLCDLGDMTFRKVALKRRPDCPVCGEPADA